jgi:EAL domain-containing protein (putative c-di-GMP-specific phosphodiesterase class I)
LSVDPRRLLGLAFAAADLLIELEPDGRIVFALGATHSVLGPDAPALIGADWRSLVHEDDRPVVEAMLAAVEDGARRGFSPVRLAGSGDRAVSLHARVLPDNGGRISCGLSPAPPPRAARAIDGLHDREGFERLARDLATAAQATGAQLELAMIELSGLADAAGPAQDRAAGALRLEAEGGAAARLSPERFALLRRPGEDSTTLARRLGRLIEAAGGQIEARAQTTALGSLSPGRLSRAMQVALEDFEAEGLSGDPPRSLTEAMNRSVKRTLARAGELGMAVSQRRFTLAFQPVVRLADNSLHHHEVLVRFENGDNPFALVRLAEEFDLIEELDQAILQQTVRRLKADRGGRERLAVNVSGRTITSPRFVTEVEGLLKAQPELGPRLLFEITESAAIDDLAVADRHVQALRALGSLVCLDDFGAGASSLTYLQRLSVDIVKIDGRYVRDLVAGGRDAAVVAHIVNLCRELNIRTVAEMVETTEVEDAVRAAGVDFGQGWLYGRPAERPEAPTVRAVTAPVGSRMRRRGTVDGWG